MRKIISFILSLVTLLSCVNVISYAADKKSDDVQNFIDSSLTLIERAPEIIEEEFSNNGVIQNGEDFDTYSEFETCRLIVESEEKPDKLNSLGIASGFKDYHIVQFSNARDTKMAFEYYSEQDDVISVFVDEIMDFSEVEVSEVTFSAADTIGRFNCWGADYTGFYELKDYLINNKIYMEEVIVGVVDTGVDLEHEFLDGRLIRTYFNATNGGWENNENNQNNSHGTMVSSVIVDSTPENVKVAVYRTTTTLSSLSLGCLQAIEDKVDIINASFGGFFDDTNYEADYWEDIVDYAYENNIIFVAPAGNDSANLDRKHHYPSDCKHAISVGAVDEFYMPTDFTNYGNSVDVSAPGQKIRVAKPVINSYSYVDGTSFSSPYVASLCAIYKSLSPDCTVDEVSDEIKSTASSHSPLFTMHKKIDKLYGSGIIDPIGATGLRRQAEVKVDVTPGDYYESIKIELSSEGSDEIYYTLDQSVPTKSNGILYTGPVEISAGGVVVKAIAYSDNKLRSEIFSGFYKVWEEESEDNFTISEDGKIQSCSSESAYIIVPETINGITAVSIGMNAFNDSKAEGVILPETVTELSKYAFSGNGNSVKYVYGEGVKNIGDYAFQSSESIIYVHFPNVENVGENTFCNTKMLFGISLPKLKAAGRKAFSECSKMLYLYLPEIESAGKSCFSGSRNLHDIYVPKLNTITEVDIKGGFWFSESFVYNAIDLPAVETFYELDFLSTDMKNRVKRVEFSNLKLWRGAAYLEEPKNSTLKHTLVLPSTVEIITAGHSRYIDGYIIYGTKGTYIEQWANEQKYLDVTFIEITPETAVITDLPEYYQPYMGELVADVVGFNRQYQWYANTVDSNEGGTPIEGATGRSFNPADYPARYYYCEVVSTDKGYDPIVIKTSACENREMAPVDYTTLEKALDKVPSDLSVYTETSRNNLEKLIEETEHLEGLNQRDVNQLARDIENAIHNLQQITITLSDTEITLERGDTFKIKAETEYDVIWSSTDETVVTVDHKGVVSANAAGEATIIARLADLNVFAECKVTVLSKKFVVTWIVDGNKTEVSVDEGAEIIKPDTPKKEGYTFIGWNKTIPDTMPSENLEFTALWEKNSHTVTWVIDSERFIDYYHYGDTIMIHDNPTKEGYTFDGWDAEVYPTVPDEDLVYTAGWKINSYAVKWNIDGEVIEENYDFGTKITEPETPKKEGYTFIGWNKTIPDTMPSKNLEFTAVFEEFVVTSVKIKTKPIKLNFIYKTENLDLTGLTLEVKYSDGTKEILNDLSEVKVTGFDNTKTGTQTVTVEYAGETAEFDVVVSYAWWQYLILIFLFGWIWY